MKILTILPTLNEETNLKILYKQIIATKLKMDPYFIDDGSKDNTVSYINKLKNKKKNFKIYLNKENKDWELVGRIKMVYFLRIKKNMI